MELLDELQSVQADALQGFQLEVAGDFEAASAAYVKASAQLQYLLDFCVPRSQSDLVVVCRGLLQTWALRFEVPCVVVLLGLLLYVMHAQSSWQVSA